MQVRSDTMDTKFMNTELCKSLCNIHDTDWERDSDSWIKKALEVILACFMVMFQDLPWGAGKECEKSDKWRRVWQDSHKGSMDFRL